MSKEKSLELLYKYSLDSADSRTVAQYSSTLFAYAASRRSMPVAKMVVEPLEDALNNRDFAKAAELLSTDPSLKDVAFHFKANPYFPASPVMIMKPYQFAFWLGDKPMMELVKKSSNMSEAEVSVQVADLGKRLTPKESSFDAGSKFNFPKLLNVVEIYVANETTENQNVLRNALVECPKYAIDSASWLFYKCIMGMEVEPEDAWPTKGHYEYLDWSDGVMRAPEFFATIIKTYYLNNPVKFKDQISEEEPIGSIGCSLMGQ